MRVGVLVLALVAFAVLQIAGTTSIVDLLLLAYAVPIQFLPLTLAALYWRRANRVGAVAGLATGLGACLVLFACKVAAPSLYAVLNPADLQIGVLGGAIHLVVLVVVSLLTPPMNAAHLAKFS